MLSLQLCKVLVKAPLLALPPMALPQRCGRPHRRRGPLCVGLENAVLATQGGSVNQEQMMRMLMQQQQQRDGQQTQKVTVWGPLPSLALPSHDTITLRLTGICLTLSHPPASPGLSWRLHMRWIFLRRTWTVMACLCKFCFAGLRCLQTVCAHY